MPASEVPAPRPDDLVRPTAGGLWCERGGFHIDPRKPAPLALITHAHADHVVSGCERYMATPATAALVRARIGDVEIEEVPFGESRTVGEASVSFHPAGHVLGSAQIRVEANGSPVWCVTGDYKTEPAPTAEAFEVVACGVLVTESTFGLPIYRWPDSEAVAADLRRWWRENAEAGCTSVLFAYSLGKAQRVMAMLGAPGEPMPGAIGVHGAVKSMCEVYASMGVDLPDHVHANKDTSASLKGTGMIVAPPSQDGTTWLRRFKGPAGLRTAMASGWMAVRGRRRWRSLDTGFVVSDHADWGGLLDTVHATGASRVGVTHGYTDSFARYLREARGLDAFELPTGWSADGGEGGA